MKFDTSFTITAIIAFMALISPVVTAIVNNHYLAKQKSLEYLETRNQVSSQHKRELFERFLAASGKFVALPTEQTFYKNEIAILDELSVSGYLILPYFAEMDRETIRLFLDGISDVNKKENIPTNDMNDFNYSIFPIVQTELEKL
ncbi:hypothetical protein [Leuconostoc pseudomesenteroides]|uniref:hypothetical protein n=1 Tax=Leuconostoc pseudomesenteroides TaxID=33968 RepID=UPI0039ED1780